MSDHAGRPSGSIDESAQNIVEFRNVSKRYGKTFALSEATFAIVLGPVSRGPPSVRVK